MYVEINSKNEGSANSAGKTSWVNTGEHVYSVSTASAAHLGPVPWHIKIKSNSTYELGNGERGGEPKAVARALEIHLTPADLSALLSFVQKKGLIEFKIAKALGDSLGDS